MSILKVQTAIYGALDKGNENRAQAVDVSNALQAAIDQQNGIVTINNANMGGDPSHGNHKQFAAIVALDGVNQYFACAEGQTIDFFHTEAPTGT